jgi:hypothetical protein
MGKRKHKIAIGEKIHEMAHAETKWGNRKKNYTK